MQLNVTTSIVDYLKSKGKTSDRPYRTQLYKQAGLENRLGGYIGTAQQNVALLNYARKQFEQPAPAAGMGPLMQKQPTTSPQVPQHLVEQFQRVQQQAGQLGTRVLTEGITGRQGQQLMPPISPQTTVEQLRPIQQTALELAGQAPQPPAPEADPFGPATTGTRKVVGGEEYIYQQGGWWKTSDWEAKQRGEWDIQQTPIEPGSTASRVEGKDIAKTVALQDTDLAGLIQQFSSGALKDVDLEVATEAKRLAMQGEEASAQKALSQMQQQMARQGMTFSGLRTKAEQDLAAQTLANKAGISNKYASAIIDAARDEQSRRETANRRAQDAATSALKAMGYIYDPITGALTKTLERERFEEPEAPKTFGSAGGGYYEYDPETGQTRQIVAPQERGVSQTITDADRVQSIKEFIAANKIVGPTADFGMLTSENYQEAARQWIALGGTTSDFKTAFPPEGLVKDSDIDKLPSILAPRTPVDEIRLFYDRLPSS